VADQGRIAIRDGLRDFIVMVGWNVSGTDFLASTLAVEFAALAPDLTQPALPRLALVPFTNAAPAPSFAWFPGLDEEDVRGNLLAKLKAGGVL